MDLAAVVPIQEGELRPILTDVATLSESHPLLTAMATCHSLVLVDQKLAGYSVDRKMFESTGWVRRTFVVSTFF